MMTNKLVYYAINVFLIVSLIAEGFILGHFLIKNWLPWGIAFTGLLAGMVIAFSCTVENLDEWWDK